VGVKSFDRMGVEQGERAMLSWAIAFLVIAMIAAALGFGGVAGTAIVAAKLVVLVSIVALLASVAVGLVGRPR
jgi:uncharacterized membrane protein YtjA (UPF0391 family)